MKLETNGVMTLKNTNLLNNNFLAKITTLEQEVNVIQQTLGTATQDIGGLQQQINVINEELNRQTHFRGYYLLNTDIQQLENSANGDFAFSAESGTVWMYDNGWYNSGDIVPDQVTPASDTTPLVDSGTGVAGTSTEYSRGDHKHPLQVSDVLPSKDTSVGTVGQASSYARSDHQHPIQTVDTIPNSDSAEGSYGAVDSYARNDHSHPINVQTNASNIPIVNGVGNNGTSAYYSRHDHVHPQQLTYEGNVTATKFIKSGGTNQQILLADGETKPIVYATRTDYITTSYQNVKLCNINTFLNNNCISVEFKVRGRSGFGILQFHQLTTIDSGLDKCNYHLKPNYQNCMQEAYALYYGSETTRTCQLWIQLSIWSNYIVINYTNSGTVTEPITNILTSSPVNVLPTDYTSMITLTPNLQFDYKTINNAPFTQNGSMQINPTATSYDDGLRVSRSGENSGNSSIQLGCSRTSNSGAIQGQWVIYSPSINAVQAPQSFIIAVATQAADDVTRGLQISADGNTLIFNGRVL
ncbi:MAG: hypothetical protein EZS28_015376 [Streblomastix strix]|uniref:Uncharacterized protein n=1 Tax=Streblomastix strix TaxID=222440 RepID=A0A5J4W355_9EUKA|nr:MAG: hypothetical protein EZS28_015376 [Streblomastix strix]